MNGCIEKRVVIRTREINTWVMQSCQEWESRERGSSPGEIQIALGAWENTQKDQGGSNTKKQLSCVPICFQYFLFLMAMLSDSYI